MYKNYIIENKTYNKQPLLNLKIYFADSFKNSPPINLYYTLIEYKIKTFFIFIQNIHGFLKKY